MFVLCVEKTRSSLDKRLCLGISSGLNRLSHVSATTSGQEWRMGKEVERAREAGQTSSGPMACAKIDPPAVDSSCGLWTKEQSIGTGTGIGIKIYDHWDRRFSLSRGINLKFTCTF